jgi:hypothetical protein
MRAVLAPEQKRGAARGWQRKRVLRGSVAAALAEGTLALVPALPVPFTALRTTSSGPSAATAPTAASPTVPTAPSAPGIAAPDAPTAPSAEANPCETTALRLRCPALIMSAPFELHLDRTTIPGRVLLRASSSIDNHGAGPMELSAHRNGAHIVVYQAIYDRHGRRHLFRTAAKLVFKHVPGERYEYGDVGAASYWKLEHAAAFQLWSVDSRYRARRLVRAGPKVDYCLRDLQRTHPLPGSPRQPVYPACSRDPNMRRDLLGTSVGWSDVYPYAYPEQWIDVTGLHGRFAYVQIVDPDRLLFDSDPNRWVSETYVELPSGRVLGHRVGVASP